MIENNSLIDRLFYGLSGLFHRYKVPFLASVIAGFASHTFMLTNKLINHDDIESMFGKGATVTSGRWGLELIKPIFPDCSMPWIYGLISIILISAAVCVMVELLEIRSKALQALAGGLVLTFPSLTGTFCFMFTSSAYALSFLLAVLAVYEFTKGGAGRVALSILFVVLSLSIYQAYVAITASLFVLIMLRRCMEAEENVGRILLFGVKAVLMMAAAAAVYYGITLLVFAVTGAEFNSYVTDNTNSVGLLRRIRMAYDAFLYVFTFRNFYLVPTDFSRYIHILLSGLIVLLLAFGLLRTKKPGHIVLGAFLALLLPLSMNSIYLIMGGESIHTLVLYSFVCLYFLAAMLAEKTISTPGVFIGKGVEVILCVILVINVYFSNMCYLKMKLEYDNAYSFYSVLISRICSTEGFDENCDIAFTGRQDNLLQVYDELDTYLLMGPSRELVNIYSRENFIKLFMGFNFEFASEDEISQLENSAEYQAMAEYPFDGSVKKIGDHIVIKLG